MTATSTVREVNEWTFAKHIRQSLYIVLMNELGPWEWGEGQGMLNKPLQAFPVGGCSFWSLRVLDWAACDLVLWDLCHAGLSSQMTLTWASLTWMGAVISDSVPPNPTSHDPDY